MAQRLLKYTPLPVGEITKYRRCAQTPLGPGQGAPDKYESSLDSMTEAKVRQLVKAIEGDQSNEWSITVMAKAVQWDPTALFGGYKEGD